jgi:hypothetical protein
MKISDIAGQGAFKGRVDELKEAQFKYLQEGQYKAESKGLRKKATKA